MRFSAFLILGVVGAGLASAQQAPVAQRQPVAKSVGESGALLR